MFIGLPILILSISGCHAAKSTENPIPSVAAEPLEYPLWFWQTPTRYDAPTAVGYAPTSQFRPESSVEAATVDGLEQLAKHVSVRIRGERISINRRQAQDFQEEVPRSVGQRVADQHKILAIHRTPKITLVFLGLGEPGDFSNQKTASPTGAEKPRWLQALPVQKGYLYGQGHCNPRYRHESGWKTAENDSRIDLALNFQSRIRHIFKRFNTQVQAVSSTQTDVVLNRIELVARWFDPVDQTYHVLARMRIDQNEAGVRQQWHSLMSQSKDMSLPSQDEVIHRAFEELDRVAH
ncbi:MAG: hypothetical protein O7E52_25410 [Candidatus Poribacteria bacterium]|nr:hypothetical protein [Candidatus Poribacteria bacterium]